MNTTLYLLLAEASSSDSWAKAIVGLIGGVIAAFFGFLLNQYHQTNKEAIATLEGYKICLQSTANELEFYASKLKKLSQDLEEVVKKLTQWKVDWIIPSYGVYPDFLEKCKITISEHQKNSLIVKNVGHCHFELCHISARLDLFKKQMETQLSQDGGARTHELSIRLINCEGFKKLVDSNVVVFTNTRDELLAEAKLIEKQLLIKKERSLFACPDD